MTSLSRRLVVAGAAGGLSLLTVEHLFGPAAAARAASPPESNGAVDPARLTTVAGSAGTVLLERSTAAKWTAMVAACRAATGVTMVVTSPDGGYRDLVQQQYRYEHPEGPVSIARPGSSTHGFGTAVDIWNRQHDWLVRHAREFDFTQTFSSEPWHWQYTGSTSTIGPDTEDDEMNMIVIYQDAGSGRGPSYGSTAVITPRRGFVQTSTGLGNRDELTAWTSIAGALGITIIEKHVDANGFTMAGRF
ncbi:M15 family metallopeptidase [Rathayibacter sp. VKM Ac-2927]|uniref:M15 family metallopeptidase n=1 Tax=Rathayibacter sp. VKM Ac-2927 TaxID=2929478 RepID=UPI0024372BA9|nr:M15 family metallopeptidase [Rathayibacter sp. VKM Ac-2927]